MLYVAYLKPTIPYAHGKAESQYHVQQTIFKVRRKNKLQKNNKNICLIFHYNIFGLNVYF